MKFGKETSEKVCKFEVDFEDSEYKMLKEYGLREIQKDDPALVNYAVNKILANEVNKSKRNKK